MMRAARLGRVGILTPMANPTVEAEMRVLLPVDLNFVVARLTSPLDDSLDRLRAYADDVAESAAQFGALALDAIGFACTGSSYLMGAARDEEFAARLSVPLIAATSAIAHELHARDVRRLAIVSPYPGELHDAGLRYWRAHGFDTVFDRRVEIGGSDTRAIYVLGAEAATGAVADAVTAKPDAILLSGTGMPTLALLRPDAEIAILSSNYCLAHALMRASRTES